MPKYLLHFLVRRPTAPRERGFTLVEIMIVVAIIGILAAIAIPNFQSFTTKAKQSEVKANLAGLYTAQVSYFGEFNTFASDFFSDAGCATSLLDWKPESQQASRYTYDLGGNCLQGKAPPAPGITPQGSYPPPAGGLSGFTAIAYANVDRDPAVDTWMVNLSKTPVDVYNDLNEKN